MNLDVRGKVLIGLVTVIFAQSVAALIWAGGAAARLNHIERQADQTRHLLERTARLEVQTENISIGLHRIESKIDLVRESRDGSRP